MLLGSVFLLNTFLLFCAISSCKAKGQRGASAPCLSRRAFAARGARLRLEARLEEIGGAQARSRHHERAGCQQRVRRGRAV